MKGDVDDEEFGDGWILPDPTTEGEEILDYFPSKRNDDIQLSTRRGRRTRRKPVSKSNSDGLHQI